MRPSTVIVYVIALAIFVGGEFRIRGRVKKRYSAHRRHRAILPPCDFNVTLIEDEWSLMEAIGKSKFIFTAKVLTVKKFKTVDDYKGKRSNLYRVYMRRVLKGDLEDLKTYVNLEGSSEETLSGSTLMVERVRAREFCAPAPRPRLSAIFLCSGGYADDNGPLRLRLLTDPVPLTLYHLDRINAAVKENAMKKFMSEMSTRLSLACGDPRAGEYFAQRLSLAIQRGNAASVLGTMPHTDILEEVFYL